MNRILQITSWPLKALISLLAVSLIGCASQISPSTQPLSGPVENKLNFVDINKFDKDLATSLSSELDEVNVFFYSKVSPNKLPDRIQKWISAAEIAGGKVKVEQPANEPAPRAILPLLSLLGTAYSTFKDRQGHQDDLYLHSARGRNVVIALERGPTGDLLVGKIQFIK